MVKYNSGIVEEICNLIRQGNSHKDAAALADIAEDTFYAWQKLHPEFAESLKKAELQCKQRNIALIQKAALGDTKTKRIGQWTAAAWLLERRYKDEYGERKEISGPGGTPITTRQVTLPGNLTPELLKKLASLPIPEANESGNGYHNDTVAGAGS